MAIFKQDNTMKRIMKNTKFIKGKHKLFIQRRILMKSKINESITPLLWANAMSQGVVFVKV